MSQSQLLSEPFAGIANDLLAAGAIQFGDHRLKIHRTRPDLPLSPHYFNCRSVAHPGGEGKVTPELVERIATLMVRSTIDAEAFDCLFAVPDGATPYAEDLGRILGIPVIRLTKRKNDDGTTCVDGIEGDVSAFRGMRGLGIEDVVTSAASSMEAVTVMTRHAMRVSDIVCVVDRQQGGYQRLFEQNIRLRSLFTFRALLDHFHAGKQIDRMKYEACLAYHAASANL
ncbi:MAG: hypothetical protein WCO25_03710 [Candidatus Uhrbacteria bacterium]